MVDIFQVDSESIKPVKKLDQKYFPYPWNSSQWDEVLGNKRYLCLGAEVRGELVGFCLFDMLQADQVHLLKIVVKESHRAQGIAHSLLTHFLHAHKVVSVYLEVDTENQIALDFYLNFGFEILVKKSRYYSNGEDAYGMLLKFD